MLARLGAVRAPDRPPRLAFVAGERPFWRVDSEAEGVLDLRSTMVRDAPPNPLAAAAPRV
jgi:hypothetical protein